MAKVRLVILLCLFLFCALLGAKYLKAYRSTTTLELQLKGERFLTTRALKPGLAKLSGRVDSVNAVEAPFSGETCAFYELGVERLESHRHTKSWHNVLTEATAERTVVLRDGFGSVAVRMAGMRFFAAKPFVIETSENHPPAERLVKYFELHADRKTFDWNQTLRFTEKCLRSEDIFYVVGTARIVPGTARQLELVKDEHAPGVVANEPERDVIASLEAEAKRDARFGVFLMVVSAIMLIGAVLATKLE